MKVKQMMTMALTVVLTLGGLPLGAVKGAEGEVAIDAKNFPDTAFRSYVSENCDIDGSGVLEESELIGTTELNVDSLGIGDLTGIEHFSALKDLYCGGNELASLDVTQNTELTYINCSNNKLEDLDLSQNAKLITLSCGGNQISTLDLKGASSLTYLFSDNCGIKSMNVNGAPSLVEMYVEENQLATLDVSSLTHLDVLACRDNQLTSLNLKGAERLGYLSCQNNRLKELDVSANPGLKLLTAYGNYITEIDVSALEDLDGLMYEDREGKHEVILDKEKKVLLYDGQAEPVPDKVIKVGQKITLKFKKKIGGIGYTDDSIIETKIKKKKNLVVKGVAPGITEIVVSDKKERTLGTFVIKVE